MSQLLQVQFRGVEEGADPKALPPGTLLLAKNCAMDKSRRLVKRAGTTGLAKTLVAGGSLTVGKRLLSTGEDIAVCDTEKVYARVPSLAKWQPIDRPPALRVTRKALVDTTRSVGALDVATSGNLLVTAFSAGAVGAALLYVQIQDITTGKVLMKPTLIDSSAGTYYPRVLVSGTSAYVFFQASATISAKVVSLTTFSIGSTINYVTDAKATTIYDAVIATVSATPRLYLAYEKASGTNRTTLADFTLAGAAVSTELTYLGTNIVSICVAASAATSRVFLAFTGSTSNLTRLVTASTALVIVAGPTTVYAGLASYVFVEEYDSTNAIVGYVQNGGSFTDGERLNTQLYNASNHGSVATSLNITYGIYAPSKPWTVAGRWYVAASTFLHPYSTTSTDAIPQPSRVVLEIWPDSPTNEPHPHAATLENQTGWFPPTGFLTKSCTDSSGNVYVPAEYRNIEPPNAVTTIPVGWNLYRLSVSEGDLFRCAVLGQGALCASGAPFWFDGASAMPYGFAHAPEIISVTAVNGGAVVAGTYSYTAVYVWRDANGVLHRSPPSPPKTGTTATTNLTLTVVVSCASLSGRHGDLGGVTEPSPVLIELYRTTIGGTGPHYRLTFQPTYQVLTNDPNAVTVSMSDTRADSSITGTNPAVALATRPQLYTDQGELADVQPPSFVTVATHRGRLVGIGPDLRTVWFSKDSREDATIAPGFNEALTLTFARDKTALATLGESLVVFGEDSIDLVHGDGPDDTGQNNSWVVQAVQTDVGCTNPRSVAASPVGVVFESARGIELLNVGLGVTWVGSTIQDTLAAYPTITSAVLVSEEQEIRFTCNAANGLTGIVLAWDYANKVWFTRTYTDAADAGTASVPFVDAALIDGVYTLLTGGGQVYQETSATKLDNGTAWVERDVVLAPISPAGNLAWHRVKDITVLGTSVTNHDLKVSVARDYSASYEYTKTFTAGGLTTATGPKELCRVSPTVQKCQAVKIRIQDITPTSPGTYPVTTGDGPILEAIALRVGVKPGPPKVAASQKG